MVESGTIRRDAHWRSLAKAVSWRVTGSVDTFVLSWVITGEAHLAGAIALTEVATKIGLYYLHERVWQRIPLGRGGSGLARLLGRPRTAGEDAHWRSVTKAVTWRVTGTLDTFLLSWLITGEAHTALSIAGVEVATKTVLYYLHERAWLRVPAGRAARNPAASSEVGARAA